MKGISQSILKILGIVVILSSALALTACEQDGPMENAGEEIDDAVEEVGDSAEDAADEVEDEVDDASSV